MRIQILSINYWPEVTGIGAFTTYRAEYLANAGHDVEVCTTFPYYPQWKVPPQYAGRMISTEEWNGVTIARSRIFVPKRVTSIKRILHEASFIVSSTLRALPRKRPDLLLVVSPPLGLALSAILLSWIWRVPYIFDVEDLQPDSAGDLGMLPGWLVKVLYKVENAAYRHARLVSTITPSMKSRIVAKGVPAEKVKLFEARMDISLAELLPEEGIAFRKRYDLGEKFLVVHSGNMGVKQGLDVVLEAAVLGRSDDSMLFLLVGDGSDCRRIQTRAADLNLTNVRFLPLLGEEDFRGLLEASGVCLVTQQKSVAEIVFPSKVVTYLAAGRPVVASVNSECEVARAIIESRAGTVVNPEDPRALLDGISDVRAQALTSLSQNARDYAAARWAPAKVLGHLEQSLVDVAGCASDSVAKEEVVQ